MAAQPPSRKEQTRSFLLKAFGISIALHVLFGPFIAHYKAPQTEKEDVQKVSVSKKVAVVVPTPPPPTPTPRPSPKPTSTPKQAPQQHLHVNVPKSHAVAHNAAEEAPADNKPGSENGVPAGAATAGSGNSSTAQPATPAPTPVPTPACARPQVPPATITAVAPDVPEIARQQGIQGRVQVKVDLDQNSHVTGVSIYSSPNPLLNKAAMDAAKQSTFRTEVQNCQPIASSYLYIVDFQSE
jgi:TonB family protein